MHVALLCFALAFMGASAALATEGEVPIIAYLNVDVAGKIHKPQPVLSPAARTKLYEIQKQLLERMAPTSPQNIKSYKYLPFVAMRLNSEGLQQLLSDPSVLQVQVDTLSKPTLLQSGPLVESTNAWTQGYTGSGQAIAILDTGVDSTHAFLAGKVVHEACFSSNNTIYGSTSICPNGNEQQVGVGAGTPCTGHCDHGTHVAGIAAGKGASYSGVAKDADIIAVQVFSLFPPSYCGGSSSCVLSYSSDQLAALEHIYDQRANYNIASINMSLGGGSYTSACDTNFLKPAVDLLSSVGIATVIASGNNGYTSSISSPACISSAVSVGSTTEADAVSYFSNSASILDLLAPGSSITSSVPGGGYSTWNGTSMATPHVAGAYAVLRSKTQTTSTTELLNALKTTGLAVTDSRNGIAKPRIRVNTALNALSDSNSGLVVTPGGFDSRGMVGGPFVPPIKIYTLTNNGTAAIGFSIQENTDWLSAHPASGTLAIGASETVTVFIDGSAPSLGRGTYSASIAFLNTTDGVGDTARPVMLSVAPENDMFSTAENILNSPVTINATNINSSIESGEPDHGDVSGGKSVWWRFTPTENISVVIDTFGSNFDTTLGVYTGTTVDNLTRIVQNDDTSGSQSLVAFAAQAGTTYYIAVDGYNAASGSIVLSLAQHAPPVNDVFINAETISSVPSSIAASSLYATIETGEPDHAGSSGGKSLWWRFTPTEDMGLVIDTFDSDYDTTLGVYTGTAVDNLTSIAGNDDADYSHYQSLVAFTAQADTTYYIAVDGYNGDSGSIVLSLAQHDLPQNNMFTNAELISYISTSIETSNLYMNTEIGEPDHADIPGGSSLWWRFTPIRDFELSIDTFGSNVDTTLGVYTGTEVNNLTVVTSNDDHIDAPAYESKVTFQAQAGTIYSIAVDGFFGDAGSIILNVNATMPNIVTDDIPTDELWSPISIDPTFGNPVVILSPPSYLDAEPGVVRVRQQNSPDRFEVRFQEWDYLDGNLAVEQFFYLILEQGRYELGDGTMIEIGSFNQGGTDAWITKNFSQSFDGVPKVFLTLQTANDDQAVTVRAKNISVSGFESALFEQQSLVDGHAIETVGYLAIYNSGGTGTLPTSSGGQAYSLNTANLNHAWQQAGNVALKLEEEQSADSEIIHIAEAVDIVTLGGKKFAQIVSFNESDPVALRRYRTDTDSDGFVDVVDADDDNDGVADSLDAFPLDPSESVDTDGDGIGNNTDTDDDGDGVADSLDALPLDPSESVDTDSDGIGNNSDLDDDNDGLTDADENSTYGTNLLLADTDGDGIADGDEFTLWGTNWNADPDSDGIINLLDADSDGDGLNDGDELTFGTNPADNTSFLSNAPIAWTDRVGVTVENATLIKTGTTGWNSGAASVQTIPGDGAVEFSAVTTDTYRMLGLSNSNASAAYNTIGYAIYLRTDGTLSVYENGTHRGRFGTYQNTDVLRVERSGSTVVYRRNGAIFYTSAVPSTGALLADAALRDAAARFDSARIIDM